MTILQDLFVDYIDTSIQETKMIQETKIATEFLFEGSSIKPEQLAMINVLGSVDIISITPNAEIETGVFGECAKIVTIELVIMGSRNDIDQVSSLLKAQKFSDDFYMVKK